jgi:hypothetical protein
MEKSQIERTLQHLKGLPYPVGSWKVEQGEDATGDPAIWVWAVLDQDEADPQQRARIRKKVRSALRSGAERDSLVYVRFRTRSEEEAAS